MRGKRILINPIDDYCNLKGELIMAIASMNEFDYGKAGYIEFKMPEKMMQDLLKTRRGDELKMQPKDFLCKVVNEDFGLKGYCVNVISF